MGDACKVVGGKSSISGGYTLVKIELEKFGSVGHV